MMLVRSPMVLCLVACLAGPLSAQVGHDPSRSPYRDITRTKFLTITAGSFGGGGGRIGTAPHDGTLFGGRLDFLAATTVGLSLEFSRGTMERLVVNPRDAPATRVSGPVDQRLTLIGTSLQLNLTGGKTWHKLAPYVGAGLGLAFASDTPEDISGFELGTRIYLKPHAGVRVFLGQKVYLRLQAAVLFYRVTYPGAFAIEPPLNPGTPDSPNAVFPNGQLKEWIGNGVLSVGLGTTFNWPF